MYNGDNPSLIVYSSSLGQCSVPVVSQYKYMGSLFSNKSLYPQEIKSRAGAVQSALSECPLFYRSKMLQLDARMNLANSTLVIRLLQNGVSWPVLAKHPQSTLNYMWQRIFRSVFGIKNRSVVCRSNAFISNLLECPTWELQLRLNRLRYLVRLLFKAPNFF